MQCQSCKAVSVFAPDRVGAALRVLRVAGARAVRRDQVADPARRACCRSRSRTPSVREQIRRWYKSKWLAPNALKSRALVDTVKGIYIPYWTFDAQVVCPWEADAGHYYYTTETYRDNKGNMQTRQVRHARWEPASGVVEALFRRRADPGDARR